MVGEILVDKISLEQRARDLRNQIADRNARLQSLQAEMLQVERELHQLTGRMEETNWHLKYGIHGGNMDKPNNPLG